MFAIDASIIVSSYFEREKFHKQAKKFLNELLFRKETILLPEIVMAEIASAIARGTRNSEYALNFCKELRKVPNFIFISIDESISLISAEVASKYFMRGTDSVYVAIAYKYRTKFSTLDKEQKKKARMLVEVIDI